VSLLWLVSLLSVSCTALPAAVVENKHLRVEFNQQAQLKVIDKRCGRTWNPAATNGNLRAEAINKLSESVISANVFGLAVNDAPLHVTITVPSGDAEVVVRMGTESALSVSEFSFPHALPLQTPSAEWIVPEQGGVRYGVTDDPYPPYAFFTMRSMPWIGVLDWQSGFGYMMILETPDDAQFIPEYLNVNDKSFLVAAPHWLPCKGKLAYERRIRYIFFDRGGYVAMAKRYRRYARKHDLLVSLKNKAKRVPQINRLAGAVDIWCNGTDPVSIGEALRSLKIDRAIVHISSVDGYSPKDRVRAGITGTASNATTNSSSLIQ